MPYFPFNMFPYSNLHNLNLDWMLMTVQALTERIMQYEGSATPYDDAPLMDGTASPGAAFKYARGDHRHPSDATKMGIQQYYQDYGGERTGYPATQNGTVGASVKWAHEDHSHPHDTTKLDKAGGEVTGVLDIVPRRCIAELTGPGWYRVLTFTHSNSADIVGAAGIQIDLVFNRNVTQTNNETHRITLEMAYNNIGFVNESSRSNYRAIDAVRYMTNSIGSTKYGYIDVHYTLNNTNTVFVDVIVHQAYTSLQNAIVATTPVLISDSPANEVEQARYNFIDTSGKRITFAPAYGTAAYGGCWYARNGEYVTLHVGLTGLTGDTNYTITTLPDGYRPVSQFCTAGGSAAYDAIAYLYVRENGTVEVRTPNDIVSLDATFMWR